MKKIGRPAAMNGTQARSLVALARKHGNVKAVPLFAEKFGIIVSVTTVANYVKRSMKKKSLIAA